jgi:peptidoglycan/LPS O-acetylase OafA/YrhL
MRFVAFVGIFFSHCFITDNQQVAVSSLFGDIRQVSINLNEVSYSLLFILTGFLNTWTIFEERFIYKKLNVLRYYMRRILGFLPLYVVIFLLGYFILPRIDVGIPADANHQISPGAYFSFLFNNSYVDSYSPLDGVLGNMWSIAVSFQFILVWPILMAYFRRRETLLMGICMAAFVAGAWFFSSEEGFRYQTLNILCDFMAGSFVAYFSFFKYKTHIFLKAQTKRTIGFIYLLFFAYLVLRHRILFELQYVQQELLFIAERIILTAVIAFFVFEQTFSSNSVLKLTKLRIFNAPGKIAYSLYVYHAIGIIIGYRIMAFLASEQTQATVLVIEPLLALSVTFVLALFSTEYFEKKFIRRKKNYNPAREYNPVGLQDAKTKSA